VRDQQTTRHPHVRARPCLCACDSAKRKDACLIGLFLVQFLALNLLLALLIVRPVRRLAGIADEVSKGNMEAPDFPSKGRDESSTLGASFNRMRRSLVEAMNMLQ
jgi:protein-histidine pros-kinase